MSDENQLQVITDLFTRAGLYPSENSHDPEHIFRFGAILQQLHNALKPYKFPEYDEQYKEIKMRIREVSAYRYTNRDRYLAEGYPILYDWYGLLAEKMDFVNILLPHNYSYTEGEEDGI